MYKVVLDLNKIDNQNNSISFKVLDYNNSDLLPNGMKQIDFKPNVNNNTAIIIKQNIDEKQKYLHKLLFLFISRSNSISSSRYVSINKKTN